MTLQGSNQEVQETSAEAWNLMAIVLRHYHQPLLITWDLLENGLLRRSYATFLELKDDTIIAKTYLQGDLAKASGRLEVKELCWMKVWPREQSKVTRWPVLAGLLHVVVDAVEKTFPKDNRPTQSTQKCDASATSQPERTRTSNIVVHLVPPP